MNTDFHLEPFGDITLEELLAGPVRKTNLWAALEASVMLSSEHGTGAIVLTQAKWLGDLDRFQVRNFSGYWNFKQFPIDTIATAYRPESKNSYAWFTSENTVKRFGLMHKLRANTIVIYHHSLI